MGEEEEIMRFFREADTAPLSKLILWEQNNDRPHWCAHTGEERVRKSSLGAADCLFRLLTLAYIPYPSSAPNVCRPCAKTDGDGKQHPGACCCAFSAF